MIAPKVPKPTAAEERRAYALVTSRDEDRCQRCLRHCGPVNRDHRKDRSVGGLTLASNLQLLGGSGTTGCHGWKTTHPAQAIAEGWGVPGWADPRTFPAARWLPTQRGTVRSAWVLYDDLGDWVEITNEEAQQRREGRAA